MFNKQKVTGHSSSEAETSCVDRTTFLTGKTCLLSCSNTDWLLDSGATDHISPNLKDFISYAFVSESDNSITVPYGSNIRVLRTGSVVLNDQITLHNVLHVPSFHFKLISVHKLCTDLDCQLIINSNACFLQDHFQKVPPILLGRLKNGLYSVKDSQLLQTSSVQSHNSSSCFISATDNAKLWHVKLRHLPFQ